MNSEAINLHLRFMGFFPGPKGDGLHLRCESSELSVVSDQRDEGDNLYEKFNRFAALHQTLARPQRFN